jgi:hypothetical protein
MNWASLGIDPIGGIDENRFDELVGPTTVGGTVALSAPDRHRTWLNLEREQIY